MNLDFLKDMCRLHIKNKFKDVDVIPNADDIQETIKIISQMSNILLDTEQKESIKEYLELIFSVEVQGPTSVLSANDDHIEWLNTEFAPSEWKFWNRYEKYLIEEGIPDKSLKSLNRSTDLILGLLENPKRIAPWDRRGLVMGSVQSGKTANYTGLICKAADAGYNVIIVLTGMHNDLRAQTQQRLDEGFLGYESTKDITSPTRKLIGVGEIDPSPRANSITNISENGDFQRQIADNFNIEPDTKPLLFVIKKHVSILENLNSWVDKFKDSRSGEVKNASLLVIDDEADQASVDTSSGTDPKPINKYIRKLLNSFEKSAYVGYTATPFANILINDRGDHIEVGEDLFPKSFIINLPTPSNYVGPDKIFGPESEENYPVIKDLEPSVESSQDWIIPKHKSDFIPTFQGNESVPPCLENAIKTFILSTAAREIRGDGDKHTSMLIHVTRYTEVQNRVHEQVLDYVDNVKNRSKFGDGAANSVFDEFKHLWDSDFVPTTRKILGKNDIKWDEIKPLIKKTLSRIEVKKINGSSQDGLNYQSKTPQCVIAIGGDKLSRGLTLEGLSVSYFLRSSNMYDTLMQMGRWFGYRPKFEDLCRIYTNTTLISYFRSILEATEELREELNHMSELKMTPREFGLKVKVHPGMLVTSRLKWGGSKEINISFSNGVAEASSIAKNVIDQNYVSFQHFSKILAQNKAHDTVVINTPYLKKKWSGVQYFESIPALDITNFLRTLQTSESSRTVVPSLIAKYINEMNDVGELIDWSVVIHSGTGSEVEINKGMKVNSSQRTILSENENLITFRRLASKNDEYIDLSSEEINRFVVESQKTEPDFKLKDVHCRRIRKKERGLLMLYIVQPLDKEGAVIRTTSPLVGFMISFPRAEISRTVTYRANSVWLDENV